MKKFYPLLLLPLLFLSSCEKEDNKDIVEVVILSIEPTLRQFPDLGFPFNQAFYMTVTDETHNYEFHLDVTRIEGFEYEEGYKYKLKVERTTIRNDPPADYYPHKYVLIEVISKTKV